MTFLVQTNAAFANEFTISGVVNRHLRNDELVFIDGVARSVESFALTGTIDISSNPTIIDFGDRYKIHYDIAFNFVFDYDFSISGTGGMLVDGNGCGLFDCNMAGLNAQDNIGHRYAWTVDDGAFFDAEGAQYPNVFVDALPYAIPPARFELDGWEFRYSSGPLETFNRYTIPTMTATRAEAVPEPSTLLLMTIGAGLFMRSRRRHNNTAT